jgi:outer membrane protein assembly factor BamB
MKAIGKFMKLVIALSTLSAPLASMAKPDLLWEHQFGWLAPLALFYQPSDDTLLAVHSREIEKLSAADGTTLSSFGTPTLGSPFVENFPTVYTNDATGVIEYLYSGGVMIDVVNQKVLWNDTRLPSHSQDHLLGHDTAFFSKDGRTVYAYGRESFLDPQQSLYAVNSADGSIAWEHVNTTFSDPTLHDGVIYAGDVGVNFTAGLYEVDIVTGEATLVWQSSVEQSIRAYAGAWSSPVVAGDRLLLLDSRYNLLFFDLDNLGSGPLSTLAAGFAMRFEYNLSLQTNGATVFGFADSGPLVRAISMEDGSLLWTALEPKFHRDENGEVISDYPIRIQIGPVSGNVYVIREGGVFVLDPATGAVLSEIERGPGSNYYPNTVIFNKDETVMFFIEDDGDASVRAYSLENLSAATPSPPAPTAAAPTAPTTPAAAPVAPPSPAGPPTTAAAPAVSFPLGTSGAWHVTSYGSDATVLLVVLWFGVLMMSGSSFCFLG